MSRARGPFGSLRLPGSSRVARRDLSLATAVLCAAAGITALAAGAAERPKKTRYAWSLPADFPTPRVPKSNPMTDAKVALGRRLFYDVRLSGNMTTSCASCHQQSKAFTDGRSVAVGATGELHPRNSQSLVNVAYMSTLTWANPSLVTLEKQMEVPLFGNAPIEMGVDDRNRDAVLARLRKDPWYRRAFNAAYPQFRSPVKWSTVVGSIASFERSIVSARSRYDRYLAGKAQLSDSEERGMNLFMGERAECHHCHGSFIFNDQTSFVGAPKVTPEFHNTGLFNIGGTGAFPEPNRGVFELSGDPQEMGKFRAPSLRNVELTAPYMHDGSIATLEAAVQHYSDGGRLITSGSNAGDGRASPLKDPLITPLRLTAQEQADLVAFLKTLTDRAVTTDVRFSNPFTRSR